MSRLKLALIPMLFSENRSSFQATYQRFMTPLGPIYLASYLESLNLPIDILVHDQIDTVLNFKPDIVGISSVSENFGYAQKVGTLFKEKLNSFNIVGGAHFTSLPNFLPDCFDAGVVGEGEIVLGQIINTFLQKGISKEHLKTIPSLVIKEDGKVLSTGRASQITHLDTLPLPDRRRWVKTMGVPHMMTTRGCVYRCFFCSEPNIFKSYRELSPSRIVEEIEDILVHYPATKHIRFFDDIFTVNRKRLRLLCQLFQENKIPERVSFSCFIHSKLVDEEIVDLLKKMNFSFVLFGADSGSPDVLKKIKPSSTVEMNQKAIDLVHKKGLKVGVAIIVGTPEETAEDLKRTYNFLRKNRHKLFDVEVNPAVVLPGTDLWDHAMQRGLIPELKTIDWDLFRDQGHLPEFDLNRYLYVAEKIPPTFFILMLRKMSKLIKEIHQLHGTEQFLKQDYLAGYSPASFRSPLESYSNDSCARKVI